MKSVKLIKQSLLLMLLTLITSTMVMAEKPPRNNRYGKTWKHLGSKTINGRIDEDRIHVGRWAGKLAAIQLRTSDDRLDLERAVVHFTNGDRQRVNLRDDWRGGESHIIKLRGGARYVSHVTYVGVKRKRYKNRRGQNVERDRKVEAWGLKANRRGKYRGKDYRRDRYRDYDRYDDRYYEKRRRNNGSCGNSWEDDVRYDNR